MTWWREYMRTIRLGVYIYSDLRLFYGLNIPRDIRHISRMVLYEFM
jgi:hypothetical protein